MTRGQSWSAAERAAAVEHVRTAGLAAAVRATGVPKSTLRRWAKAAGLTDYTAPVTAQQVEALEAAHAARALLLDEARTRQVELLNVVAEAGLNAALHLVKRAHFEGDPRHLPGVVGAFTRARHDLQLLTGEETERQGVQVNFSFPVDDPHDVDVIDVVPQARIADVRQLHRGA